MSTILESLLKEKVTYDEFVAWFTRNGKKDQCNLLEIIRAEDENSIRGEFVFTLLNFLREQTAEIVNSAQSCGQTPSKANRPTRYDYASPLKQLKTPQKPDLISKDEAKVLAEPASFVKAQGTKSKKRTQLFGDDLSYNAMEENSRAKGDKFYAQKSVTKVPKEKLLEPAKSVSKSFNNASGRSKGKRNSGGKSGVSSPSLGDFINVSSIENQKKSRNLSQSSRKIALKTLPPASQEKATPEQTLDLINHESFPPIGSKEKKEKRRIRPTLVGNVESAMNLTTECATTKENRADPFGSVFRPQVCSSPFSAARIVEKDDVNCVNYRENLLKDMDRLHFDDSSKKKSPLTTPINSPNKLARLNRAPSVSESVKPTLLQVTHLSQIDILVKLYCFCICQNLVPNILVELYFLFELLVVQDFGVDDLGIIEHEHTCDISLKTKFFKTVHNCVYFSVMVLESQFECISHCDKATLKLLLDNPRLLDFNSNLRQKLVDICVIESLVDSAPDACFKNVTRSLLNVSFQTETDNRQNFPSDQSFHNFKKQRDMFYEIIRLWENQCKDKDFSFSEAFSARIKNLLSLNEKFATNYVHFCRLFVLQMLAMCQGESEPELQNFTGNLELMVHLKKTDPIKYRRLQSRLVTPLKFGGPCPPPSFTGAQEFFRDFITYCNNFKYICHLRNILALKIVELNKWQGLTVDSMQQFNLDFEEEKLREDYAMNVMNLRLLAKFLGHVDFFMYQEPVSSYLPENIMLSQLELRGACKPTLDLVSIIQESIIRGNLILTIPWVVEYLSMMDKISYYIPFYQLVLQLLVTLYQKLTIFDTGTNELFSEIPRLSRFFLCLILGWFFEGSNFPKEFFFHANILKIDLNSSTLSQCFDDSFGNKSSLSNRSFNSIVGERLDNSKIITGGLLYLCCPYLRELKVLLSQFFVGPSDENVEVGKSEKVKKITPISADFINKNKNLNGDTLQLELEENFFHNQPNSLRKIVDFVSERLASNVVKLIRQELIPSEKEVASKHLATEMKKLITSKKENNKSLNSQLVDKISTNSFNNVKMLVMRILEEKTKEKCHDIIKNLLVADINKRVFQVSIDICLRTIDNKVRTWMNQHITLDYFSKEYQRELEKILYIQGKPEKASDSIKNMSDKSGNKLLKLSTLLIDLKRTLQNSLIRNIFASDKVILEKLAFIKECLKEGSEKPAVGMECLSGLTLDWAVVAASKNPDSLTSNVLDAFTCLWKNDLDVGSNSHRVLSPRNVEIMRMSSQSIKSWSKFENLVTRLLTSELLDVSKFETQCVMLFRCNWPRDLMLRFASCLSGVVETWKRGRKMTEDGSEFVELMDWLVWYCTESGNEDDLGNFDELLS